MYVLERLWLLPIKLQSKNIPLYIRANPVQKFIFYKPFFKICSPLKRPIHIFFFCRKYWSLSKIKLSEFCSLEMSEFLEPLCRTSWSASCLLCLHKLYIKIQLLNSTDIFLKWWNFNMPSMKFLHILILSSSDTFRFWYFQILTHSFSWHFQLPLFSSHDRVTVFN